MGELFPIFFLSLKECLEQEAQGSLVVVKVLWISDFLFDE